jgi:hypothetical protein
VPKNSAIAEKSRAGYDASARAINTHPHIRRTHILMFRSLDVLFAAYFAALVIFVAFRLTTSV